MRKPTTKEQARFSENIWDKNLDEVIATVKQLSQEES